MLVHHSLVSVASVLEGLFAFIQNKQTSAFDYYINLQGRILYSVSSFCDHRSTMVLIKRICRDASLSKRTAFAFYEDLRACRCLEHQMFCFCFGCSMRMLIIRGCTLQ
jgi:hypothetical protein